MPCELNRAVYEQLLREDLEWLLKQPRTLDVITLSTCCVGC